MFNKFETPTEYHSPFTYLDPLLKEDDYYDPPCTKEQYEEPEQPERLERPENLARLPKEMPKKKGGKKSWYEQYEREIPFLLIIVFVVIFAIMWSNISNLHAKLDMLMMNKK